MKVKEVMTPNATAIWLTENLADAAKLMWDNDCGVLPIIKDGRKVVGMITDRDICMAMAMRDTNPSGVSVENVMSGRFMPSSLKTTLTRHCTKCRSTRFEDCQWSTLKVNWKAFYR